MLLYEEETGKILKACMNVFNELGNGFLEAVYQEFHLYQNQSGVQVLHSMQNFLLKERLK